MAKKPSKTNPSASDAKSRAAKGLTYAAAGVDLETYDQFISTLGRHLRKTHTPRVIQNPGGFAGLFRLDYNQKLFQRNYKDPVLVACTDGVGTKIKLAAQLGIYDTLGIALVAMSVNDLIVQGAEPLFFLDYIAIPSTDPVQLEALVRGVSNGCRTAGCALIGGETAEMPDLYEDGDLDMAGFAVGVVELKRAINPTRVQPGDVILGLASSGFHSNGYSLVRKVVEHAKLDLTKPEPKAREHDADDRTLGQVLLEPTRIYADPIVRLQRAYRVKKVVSAMAHITGGGLEQNIERSLHDAVDAHIRLDSWRPHPVFSFIQSKGRIADDEMRRVFNMGIGYVLIVRPSFASAVESRLARLGERVHQLGVIRKGTGKVKLK